MTKTFSPSQTRTWFECPMKRQLKRRGWVPKVISAGDSAALRGRVLAAGLAAYNTMRREHEASGASVGANQLYAAAVGLMDRLVAQQMEEWERNERSFQTLPSDGELKPVYELLQMYIAKDPLKDHFGAYRILECEESLGPEAGDARPDLVIEAEDGRLVVVDYKLRKFLRKDDEEQALHYAYFVGKKYGRPVDAFVTLTLHHSNYNTKSVGAVVDTIDPEWLEAWYQSRRDRVWPLMAAEDAGEATPALSPEHQRPWGPCEYYDACVTFKWDEGLMRTKYFQLERVPEEVGDGRD